MSYDSRSDTHKHIEEVGKQISIINKELLLRKMNHDLTKLSDPEKEIFDKVTPLLKGSSYGSDEYNKTLERMKPALDHHYANNMHHPEAYENGIYDMNLVDLIEMLCDWYAATKRHDDGDIRRSIIINKKRFGYNNLLERIFNNTIDLLECKQ